MKTFRILIEDTSDKFRGNINITEEYEVELPSDDILNSVKLTHECPKIWKQTVPEEYFKLLQENNNWDLWAIEQYFLIYNGILYVPLVYENDKLSAQPLSKKFIPKDISLSLYEYPTRYKPKDFYLELRVLPETMRKLGEFEYILNYDGSIVLNKYVEEIGLFIEETNIFNSGSCKKKFNTTDLQTTNIFDGCKILDGKKYKAVGLEFESYITGQLVLRSDDTIEGILVLGGINSKIVPIKIETLRIAE